MTSLGWIRFEAGGEFRAEEIQKEIRRDKSGGMLLHAAVRLRGGHPKEAVQIVDRLPSEIPNKWHPHIFMIRDAIAFALPKELRGGAVAAAKRSAVGLPMTKMQGLQSRFLNSVMRYSTPPKWGHTMKSYLHRRRKRSTPEAELQRKLETLPVFRVVQTYTVAASDDTKAVEKVLWTFKKKTGIDPSFVTTTSSKLKGGAGGGRKSSFSVHVTADVGKQIYADVEEIVNEKEKSVRVARLLHDVNTLEDADSKCRRHKLSMSSVLPSRTKYIQAYQDMLNTTMDQWEAEQTRLAEKAEAARLAKEAEAVRLAEEAEATRLAKEAEKTRLAEEAEATRLAQEAEAVRLAKDKAQMARDTQAYSARKTSMLSLLKKQLEFDERTGHALFLNAGGNLSPWRVTYARDGARMILKMVSPEDGEETTYDAEDAALHERIQKARERKHELKEQQTELRARRTQLAQRIHELEKQLGAERKRHTKEERHWARTLAKERQHMQAQRNAYDTWIRRFSID
jgi:hypothetical protein